MCGSVFVFDRGVGSNRSNQNEDKIGLQGGKEGKREVDLVEKQMERE